MNQKVLKTKAVYKAQTGVMVAKEIGDILDEFGMRGNVAAVIVNNAPNMDEAVKKLHIIKIVCFAQTLNLGAQSLYTITSVAKIRDVIVWMKRSSMAEPVLREKQHILSKDHYSSLS